MVNNARYGWFFICVIVIVFITACSGKGDTKATTTGDAKASSTTYTGGPVELILQDNNSGITEEEFQKLFVDGVKAKYPEISLKLVKGGDIEKMIVSGETPDLVAVSNPVFYLYENMNYPEELTPMIKKYNIDLNRIEPVLVAELSRLSKDGGIYGLPFGMNTGAMIFNKDLFDKFAVPYPKDGMTWEENLQLTRQMTRLDNGVQYFGSAIPSISNTLKQYGVSSVDSKGYAVYTLDGHKAVFSMFEQYFRIPGFVQGTTYQPSTFFSKQNVAMNPAWINGIASSLQKTPPDFNWGITGFPVFANNPTRGNPVDFHMLLVSKASKHKEAAYQVVMALISDQIQLASNKNARPTILKDSKMKATYAEDFGVFKGKSLDAVFKVGSVANPYYSVYNAEILAGINGIVKRVALEKIDINTASREFEESTNLAIRTLQAQQTKK